MMKSSSPSFMKQHASKLHLHKDLKQLFTWNVLQPMQWSQFWHSRMLDLYCFGVDISVAMFKNITK